MLITNLGRARRTLVASFRGLSDAQLNHAVGPDACSIARIVHHLHLSEVATATSVLQALSGGRGTVAERDLSALSDEIRNNDTAIGPLTAPLTRAELIGLLEASRFTYLQRLFNKTHVKALSEASLDHPLYGVISLKNMVDTIWLHEQQHTRQIETLTTLL